MVYPGFCKQTELHIGFSRDGFHFTRADSGEGDSQVMRKPFVPSGQDSHLWYQQPVAGNYLVMGDEIWFYYGKRRSRKLPLLQWNALTEARSLHE